MVYRKIAGTLAAFSLVTFPSISQARPDSWDTVVENAMRYKISMMCDYVNNSVRDVSVDDYDNSAGAVVVSARYDYRCSKNTSTDIVSITFRNGDLICYAFAFYDKRCNINGNKVDR